MNENTTNYGFAGRIATIDLSIGSVTFEYPNHSFYRTYWGGGLLGAYFLFRDMKPGVDPFAPESVLVFACSVCTGTPITGASRFAVTAKSPLGGAIGESQAGGYWGAELKFAGFDALVIKGKSPEPSFLWVHDGEVDILSANKLWGLEPAETQTAIRRMLDDERIRVATIGIGGENRVRFACIVNENRHFNGRCGMGAVMGSKLLKAIAVRGHSPPEVYDQDALAKLARMAIPLASENPVIKLLSDLGTNAWMTGMDEEGSLPTRNFTSGTFDNAREVSIQKYRDLGMHKGSGNCHACIVHCKQLLQGSDSIKLDDAYGAPEYESAAALGPYLEISNPIVVAKANELCSRYTLDTISTGATIAFAMECYENGLLTTAKTEGLDLSFGKDEILLPLIEKIARREGIGDLLAEGSYRAANIIGAPADRFAMHTKGIEIPAHLPQGKQSLALAYASLPFGADHCSAEHDYMIAPSVPSSTKQRAWSLGLGDLEEETHVLNEQKARFFSVTQRYRSIIESLCLCHYCYALTYIYSPSQLAEIVHAISGWGVNVWELMKAGERRINLHRSFNAREGIDRVSDRLSERFHQPLGGEGPNAGRRIDPDTLTQTLDVYYQMMGWDQATGNPSRAKLVELGLSWVADELDAWDSPSV